jgi:peptidoglycan/LPS O-acetylase OafA/YrhL
MGAMIALLCESPTLSARLQKLGMPLFFFALADLAVTAHLGYGARGTTILGNTVGYTVVALMSTGLVLWASVGHGPLYRVLTLAPLRYIGRISYMAYLIHLPMIDLVKRLGPEHGIHNALALGCTALTLTLVFATVTWYTIERRLLA